MNVGTMDEMSTMPMALQMYSRGRRRQLTRRMYSHENTSVNTTSQP